MRGRCAKNTAAAAFYTSGTRARLLRRSAESPGFTRKSERETGFEPATSTLARWHSTAELLPRIPGRLAWCMHPVKPTPSRGELRDPSTRGHAGAEPRRARGDDRSGRRGRTKL